MQSKKNSPYRDTAEINLFLITIKPGTIVDNWRGDQIKQIKVIQHITSPCKCGSRMCASNMLGITTQNDTIRVFTICDTLVNIGFGRILVINKQEMPKSEFSINNGTAELDMRFPVYFGKSK